MSVDKLSLRIAREALVVFEDRQDSVLLRALRPGFRHCYCLVGENQRWVLHDPLKSRIATASVDGLSAHELARILSSAGQHVLHGLVLEPTLRARGTLRFLTCVEVVKRLIGLDVAAVLTPFQLYRHLCLEAKDSMFVHL